MRTDADDAAIFAAAELADVHEMISGFAQGYETLVSIDGSPLSGGQKQRIGLGAGLLRQPAPRHPGRAQFQPRHARRDGARAGSRACQGARHHRHRHHPAAPRSCRSVDKILVLRNGAVEALGPRDEILRRLSTTKPVAPRPDQGGKPQGQGRNDKRPDSGPQPGE